jgi:uncharacterized protein YecT (DUF1311 family)
LDQFSHDVADVDQCKSPPNTASQFVDLDRMLNEVYKTLVHGPRFNRLDMGTLEKGGITKTQRAWLAYRNSWTRLATIACPQVAPEAWQATLTERRLKQLSELAPPSRFAQ